MSALLEHQIFDPPIMSVKIVIFEKLGINFTIGLSELMKEI